MRVPAYSILSCEEAAKRLRISRRRMAQFCKEGRVGKRLGGRWVIQEAELEQFQKQPRRVGRPPNGTKR